MYVWNQSCLSGIDLDSRLWRSKKAEMSTAITSWRFESVKKEFGRLWTVVGLMTPLHILSQQSGLRGRAAYGDFIYRAKKTSNNKTANKWNKYNFNVGWHLFTFTDFSQPWHVDRHHLRLHFQLNDLIFIQGHSCMRKQNFLHLFLTNFSIDLEVILYSVATCWLVEAHAKFILCHVSSNSRERTLFAWFYKMYLYGWLVVRSLWVNFFQTWYDDRHH